MRSLVVLGDSVTTGSTCDCAPFGSVVAQHLSARTGHRVRVTQDGVDGSTVVQLRQLLDSDEDVRADVRHADLVLVTAGANDLLDLVGEQDSAPPWVSPATGHAHVTPQGNVGGVIDRIHRLAPDARSVVTDYWNVFTDGPSVDASTRRYNRAVTAAFDDALHEEVDGTGATFVDLVGPFRGGTAAGEDLLLEDGDHPSAAGHRRIAGAVLAALDVSAD